MEMKIDIKDIQPDGMSIILTFEGCVMTWDEFHKAMDKAKELADVI